MSKALIAMSGGVDSSVAAKLMCDAGFECIGCTMKLFDAGNAGDRQCCSADDTEDARNVAYKLGMPFYAFNYKEEFREAVIDNFVDSYLSGKTPNPCIECNRCLKFGKLLERAQVLGCDCVVTGHYARITEKDGEMVLLKGLDESKDQSYVLYMLNQEQLRHIRFPLGELTKSEVRRIAQENGFINAKKPDSQDICFVPEGDYAAVVCRYLEERAGIHGGLGMQEQQGPQEPAKPDTLQEQDEVSITDNIVNGGTIAAGNNGMTPGNFVSTDGRVLGRHKGLIHYTVGQRKGLGISADRPLYVRHIDVARNEVVLSDNEDLFTREVYVPAMSFTTDREIPNGYRCSAKIRYHHKEQPGTLVRRENGYLFTFDEPQRAITPGQSLVLYDQERVMGGGYIGCED